MELQNESGRHRIRRFRAAKKWMMHTRCRVTIGGLVLHCLSSHRMAGQTAYSGRLYGEAVRPRNAFMSARCDQHVIQRLRTPSR